MLSLGEQRSTVTNTCNNSIPGPPLSHRQKRIVVAEQSKSRSTCNVMHLDESYKATSEILTPTPRYCAHLEDHRVPKTLCYGKNGPKSGISSPFICAIWPPDMSKPSSVTCSNMQQRLCAGEESRVENKAGATK